MTRRAPFFPPAAPAAERLPAEFLETARRLAGAGAFRCGLRELAGDHRVEPFILRQAEQEMDAVVFAPRHQIIAGEAGIDAHQNAHRRPAAANLANDGRHRLHRAVRRVDARAPQLGVQQMASAEYVKRQIAVAVVIEQSTPAAVQQ